MISTEDMNLLIDLALLTKKYGPSSFEHLKTLLNTGEISSMLDGVFEVTKDERLQKISSTRSSRTRRRATATQMLSSIMGSKPQKYAILSEFYAAAKGKKILVSRRDAVDFAITIGIRPPKKADRESVISAITRKLLSLPDDQIRNLLTESNRPTRTKQGLEGWANIIFGKKQAQKDAFEKPID